MTVKIANSVLIDKRVNESSSTTHPSAILDQSIYYYHLTPLFLFELISLIIIIAIVLVVQITCPIESPSSSSQVKLKSRLTFRFDLKGFSGAHVLYYHLLAGRYYHLSKITQKNSCKQTLSLIEREIRFTDPPTQHQPTQSSYQPILPPTNLPTIPPTIDEKVEWFETGTRTRV